MPEPIDKPLGATDLIALANDVVRDPDCASCRALVCAGWESVPGSVARDRLERVGTLRDAAIDEPTVAEYHPSGSHGWSADAPIAPAWFPYNRCDAWRCATCGRPFLRYTEHGGYYTEERIREIDPRLVVDVPPPA